MGKETLPREIVSATWSTHGIKQALLLQQAQTKSCPRDVSGQSWQKRSSHCAPDEPERKGDQPQHKPAEQKQRKKSRGSSIKAKVLADFGGLETDVAGVVKEHHDLTYPCEPALILNLIR